MDGCQEETQTHYAVVVFTYAVIACSRDTHISCPVLRCLECRAKCARIAKRCTVAVCGRIGCDIFFVSGSSGATSSPSMQFNAISFLVSFCLLFMSINSLQLGYIYNNSDCATFATAKLACNNQSVDRSLITIN